MFSVERRFRILCAIAAPLVLLPSLVFLPPATTRADEADLIFDDTEVLTYELSFAQPDWWDSLTIYFEMDDPPYLPATFTFQDQVFDSVGVRFKGNSSYYGYPGVKKSFKLKFDKFHEEQRFYGLKKTNLNNSFKDPTMLREKVYLDFLRGRSIPAMRANHVRLLINGELWGLYVQVEQVDKIFFQGYYGDDEDGNLFKGDPHGTMEWLGPDPEPYKHNYELKTNEEEDDWSDLIHLIDVLNHTPIEMLQDSLGANFDAPVFLEFLAANNLFVNLDAYIGTGHNYYVYHRQSDDRFVHFTWDCNEAFGNFNYGMPLWQIYSLDPHWLPPSPPPRPRPLVERIWEIYDWDRSYLRWIATMLRENFIADSLHARIDELADMIRPYVYEDMNKMFTNSQFETNLQSPIQSGPFIIPGLKEFVSERIVFMEPRLDQFASRSDLALNELQSVNATTCSDEWGDFDPWLEIYNRGPGRVHIQEVYLTNDPEQPFLWTLPNTDLEDGVFLLLWIDGEPEEGDKHASFALDPAGGTLQLYKSHMGSPVLIDEVTYPPLETDAAYARIPDGEGAWEVTHIPTPNEPNVPDAPNAEGMFINEFLASNDTVLADEFGEYDDWVEIVNLGDVGISLAEWGLTDDLADPLKWTFPDTTIAPGAFMIIWTDDDPEQGPLHTTFKLSASGEQIGLFLPDATPVDTLSFGEQTTDISMGRLPDGGENWVFFESPTPGASNGGISCTPGPDVTAAAHLCPSPFTGNRLTLRWRPAEGGHVSAGVYDFQGRRVALLRSKQALAGNELILHWDGMDARGCAVPSGIYLIHLKDRQAASTIRLLRIR